MAHSLAPQGYQSNYTAILDLIRFGFAIWSASQMAVLLYHAERSTAIGKDADQHSQRQATEGIYSARQLRWIRGPAGVSLATWKRANAELEQTMERPEGVLKRTRHENQFGKDDPTEYEIDWPAIKKALLKWQGGVSQRETHAGVGPNYPHPSVSA